MQTNHFKLLRCWRGLARADGEEREEGLGHVKGEKGIWICVEKEL